VNLSPLVPNPIVFTLNPGTVGITTLTLDLNNKLLTYCSVTSSSNINILVNKNIDNCNNIIYTISNSDDIVLGTGSSKNRQLSQRNKQRSQIQKRNTFRHRLLKR